MCSVRIREYRGNRCLPMPPQSNGKAERMMGTIKRAISKTSYLHPQQWDEVLPSVLFGYRRRRLSDGYSSFGMVIGLAVIVFTDFLWLDSAIAIFFGFIIIFAGIKVINSALSGIMDEVDYKLVHEIVEVLNENRQPDFIDIHNLRVIKYGTDLHIDCHITIPWFFNTFQAHDEVKKLEDLLKANTEKIVEFFIHVDPCLPQCCLSCLKKKCSERKSEFSQQIIWTVENVMLNKKHSL